MSFSASDDTLAPPGQHVVTIWGQWYPYALADGADWDDLAESEAARLVAAVDRYAPGFADSVQRLYVQTPLALERELSLPRGNVMHVEMGLASMFGFRPTPALSGYTRARPARGSTWPARPPIPAAGCRATPAGRRPACCSPTVGALGPRAARPCGGAVARRRPMTTAVLVRGAPRLAPAAAPLPLALAVLLVLTAIAYPLTSGAGARRGELDDRAPGRRAVGGPRRPEPGRAGSASASCALVAVTAVGSRRWAWPPAFPYGRYEYSDALGPTLLGVPFLVPLAWLMMAWPSWVLADRLARGGAAAAGARRPDRWSRRRSSPPGTSSSTRSWCRPGTGRGRTRPRAARHPDRCR